MSTCGAFASGPLRELNGASLLEFEIRNVLDVLFGAVSALEDDRRLDADAVVAVVLTQ